MRATWLLAAMVATAGAVPSAERPPARRSPALEALVHEAEAADPEFAADILIRAAQAAGAADPRWEHELLDEAFLRAYAAQQPYRRTSVPLPPNTRQHADALAADTPLDTVSLQLRVVQLMRLRDPDHARELFESIDVPLEASPCESALVPAVDEYYQALAALTRDTFPKTALGRADALQFLELYLWRASLPSEMPAVAKALGRLRRTPEEAAYFETVFRVLLQTADHDPRAFSTAGLDLVGRVTELEEADKRLGVLGSHLSDGLRTYLVAQLRGARCSDSLAEGRIVEAFNAMVSRRGVVWEGVAPLASSEAQPARLLGAMRIDYLWQSAEARRLYNEGLDLRGPGEKPVAMKVRQTEAWQAKAARHLANLDEWTGLSEPNERDAFFEKGVLYIGLVDLVPHGALRTRVLRAFADFLHRSDAQHRRQLWFAVATRLIELTRSDDASQVIPIMERSGHQVLALYAHAARLLSRDVVADRGDARELLGLDHAPMAR